MQQLTCPICHCRNQMWQVEPFQYNCGSCKMLVQLVPVASVSSSSSVSSSQPSTMLDYLEHNRQGYSIAVLRDNLIKEGCSQSSVDQAIKQISWVPIDVVESTTVSRIELTVTYQAELLGGAKPNFWGGDYTDNWRMKTAYTAHVEIMPITMREYDRVEKGTLQSVSLLQGELQCVNMNHRDRYVSGIYPTYCFSEQDKVRLKEAIEFVLYHFGDRDWDVTEAFSVLDGMIIDAPFELYYSRYDSDSRQKVPIKPGTYKKAVFGASLPHKITVQKTDVKDEISITLLLQRLKEVYELGLLTEQEYKQKREALVAKL